MYPNRHIKVENYSFYFHVLCVLFHASPSDKFGCVICPFYVAVPDVGCQCFSQIFLMGYLGFTRKSMNTRKRKKFTEPFTFGQRPEYKEIAAYTKKAMCMQTQSKIQTMSTCTLNHHQMMKQWLLLSDMPGFVSCSLVFFNDLSIKPTILFSLVEPEQACKPVERKN